MRLLVSEVKMKNKNYILIIFICTLLLGYTKDVFGVTISANDIPNNTYVIGTHMYNEESLLTTNKIMLDATTIFSDNPSDMVIYYKAPRGAWNDGLSGNNIEIKSDFEINYVNDVANFTLKYGDIHKDGQINGKDITELRRILAGHELTAEANVLNADINADGKTNEADVTLLRKYLSGYYSEVKFHLRT